MLNLRYILRLVSAFLARFKTLIFICAGLGVLFFFALRFFLPLMADGTAKRVGIVGRYTTANLPPEILQMVGRGLTKLDPSGGVEPDLAEKWETPDKGTTWVFVLRDDIFWQDGKKVVSSALNYQFSNVSVEHPDEKTIVFKLQNAYSAFPGVVSRPVFKKGFLGTGQWEVKSLSVSGSFVASVVLVKNSGEKITYKFYPTEERTKLAFELGEVSEVRGLLDPSPLNTWQKVQIETTSNTGEYVGVFFNTGDTILGDKNIRQALSYAIDKEALGGLRAISPLSIDSWAYNPQVKQYNYDAEKAKGVIDDFKKESKSEELTIGLTATPALLPQAEKIQKDWEAVGVKTNLQISSTIPTDFQALLAIYDIPDDPDQYSIWHSTQTATNFTHYQDPRIDKLLEDGRSQINSEERKKAYLDFQRFLVEDAPVAFLYYPTTFTISR